MSTDFSGEKNGDGLVYYTPEPEKRRDQDGFWEWTYKGWCKAAVAESIIPPHRSSLTEGSSLYLNEVVVSPNATPGMVDVTLVYRDPSTEDGGSYDPISTHADGAVEKGSRADWQEVPVDDDRLVSSGYISTAQRDELKNKKYKTVGIGGVEYTYVQFIKSFEWSQSNVAPDSLGKTGAPLGMTSGNTTRWLLAGVDIQSDGVDPEDGLEITRRTLTYRYSAIGWANSIS